MHYLLTWLVGLLSFPLASPQATNLSLVGSTEAQKHRKHQYPKGPNPTHLSLSLSLSLSSSSSSSFTCLEAIRDVQAVLFEVL
ncbi:MAG: hypothetical protein J8272_00320, partial ['Prunus persica' phytoplasma PP2]|nr:hypothetical protein ['Prunus persica' phytoplasma PP2]